MDKPLILGIPNLVEKGIFINIIILSWRQKIDNKELFQLKNLEDFAKVLLNKPNIFIIMVKKLVKHRWFFNQEKQSKLKKKEL